MNNAGVMFTLFGRTAEGFEMQFGTNRISTFLLTRAADTPTAAAARGRHAVVGWPTASDIDLDDPNWQRREYDKFAAYGASKTANIPHVVELDRRLRDQRVRAYAVHPESATSPRAT